MTIKINKDVREFLQSAIDPKNKHNRMHYFLMTDVQKLVTTDGYRMHIWPMDEIQIPGYYEYNKSRDVLTQVSDEEVGYEGMYLSDTLGYPRIQANVDKEQPLMIYSCGRKDISPICVEEFPKIVKRKDGKFVVDMTFRKGIVDGEERVICLGINALPVVWNTDGVASVSNLDDCVTLDAKFALDALQSHIVHPTMRYMNNTKWTPVIIGHTDGAHALIMPCSKRR